MFLKFETGASFHSIKFRTDRDGQYFQPLLEWFRTGDLSIPPSMNVNSVLREADFYCLQIKANNDHIHRSDREKLLQRERQREKTFQNVCMVSKNDENKGSDTESSLSTTSASSTALASQTIDVFDLPPYVEIRWQSIVYPTHYGFTVTPPINGIEYSTHIITVINQLATLGYEVLKKESVRQFVCVFVDCGE